MSEEIDANEDVVEQILKEQATPPDAGAIHETDLGNARRLVKKHGSDIRHITLWDKWLIWDGKRWKMDETRDIFRLAKETVMDIYDEAKDAPNADRREALAKHAVRSESQKYQNAMILSASSEPGIPLRPVDLDRNPWLLNCLNGTIDLRTGQLYPHDRTHLYTKLSPVHYDPDAKAPLWESFLNKIMDENNELITYLKRAVGYSLSGDCSEQCFFLLYGTGANGKSTTLSIIGEMMGDYATVSEFSTFMAHKYDGIRNDVAKLMGVRFVSAVEAKAGGKLDEVLVKHLTGQDTVTARFLFHEYFDFKPTFKLWLAANHHPRIDGQDHAMWRRVKLIPFKVKIPEPEQDKRIAKKLKAELSGILAWAVKGCLEWQKDGLREPKDVTTATSDYKDEMDFLGAFVKDCCIEDQRVSVAVPDLYTAYQEWCKRNAQEPLSGVWFGRNMSDRGFSVKGRIRHGIRLKDPKDMV